MNGSIDPICTPGDWNSDSTFAAIHTQSPSLTMIGNGRVYGGLDSRFDFILVSDAILSGSKGIRYVPGTYHAVGNDGQHFDKAITDAPTTTSVSAAMAQNLYFMSNHLPVVAGFEFTPSHPVGVKSQTVVSGISVVNPFSNSIILNGVAEPLQYVLTTIDGRVEQAGPVAAGQRDIVLNKPLPVGLYFLRIVATKGETASYRLLRY